MFFFKHSYITIVIAVIAIWAMPVNSVVNMPGVQERCANIMNEFGGFTPGLECNTLEWTNELAQYTTHLATKFDAANYAASIATLRNAVQYIAENSNYAVVQNVPDEKLKTFIETLLKSYSDDLNNFTFDGSDTLQYCKQKMSRRDTYLFVELMGLLN